MIDRPAWTLLHTRLHRTLKQRRLLEQGQRVLVAVSGGQDSLCLVKLLLDLQPHWAWELAIAHCDHGWREDSGANADYVQQLAQSWQLPYYQQSAEHPVRSEAAARQWRYQALTAIAQTHAYSQIATGHTASDRAETLLYNLLRGSGADGLQALTWKRPIGNDCWLVRPLLTITRSETAQFCQELGVTVWEDSSNQNLAYARNRLRLELLPYLKTHFNPQAEQKLAQTAELLQAEVEYLEQEAQSLLERSQHPEKLGLNRLLLQQSHPALQRRAIRQFLQSLLPCSPRFEHIEKLMALLSAPNRSQTDPFPGGAIAQVDQAWIWFIQPHARNI